MTTRVQRFRSLHDDFLVIPCAWDVGSAALMTQAGAEVIGTTSAGMAWSHGRPDGTMTADVLLTAVTAITKVTDALVTVDIEHGYSDDVDEVTELIDALALTGVVGVNIEDSIAGDQLPLESAAQRLAAVRAGLDARGRDVFLNARIDTWLLGSSDLDDVVLRARAYADAGADGIFIPAVPTPEIARRVVDAVDKPVNVMSDGTKAHDLWRNVGVRRISSGMALTQAFYAEVAPALRAWQAGTSCGSMVDFTDMQTLLVAGARP